MPELSVVIVAADNEQRAVPDLSWPLIGPVLGFLFGIFGWIFLWNSSGKWLIPIGVFIGFLVGYQFRGQSMVAIRFRRCREHLHRTRFPRLRTFRTFLIIGIGDRKVWRRFYYGDRDLMTQNRVPQDLPASQVEDGRPSYPTIPLVGDDDPPGESPFKPRF